MGFVAGLKQRGYFTGDPGAYTRSVSSLTRAPFESRIWRWSVLTR